MTAADATANFQFKAEIKQLLDILVHSLYKEQDIFLRELISNASDALTRMSFEMLTNKDVLDPEAALEVRISVPEVEEGAPKKLIIRDTGIGMTRDELVENLGTIAQSGARNFLRQLESSQADIHDVIGQFGVGFYSVFMVADEVRVVSRSYRYDAPAYAWVSSGDDSFRIEEAEKADRGTEIQITLKADAAEFANEWQLRQVIKKHSDFIAYPIYVGDEQANQQQSLWRQSTGDVSATDYNKFYQQMTMDFEEPLLTVHFSSDAPVSIRALLFVPRRRDRGMLSLRREPGVKLYSNNVMIQEYCTDLLPKWLSFVDGVVDSEDLPLNVSRETVQNNRLIRQLAKVVRKRLVRELKQMADDDPEKYAGFWKEYGRVFKEGLATDPSDRDDMLPLFRAPSSTSDGELVSLDAYVERMPATQDTIYYVLGEDLKSVRYSPHLDPFKAHDLEVLYWTDPLDVFVAPLITEYREKPVKNIEDVALDLPEPEENEDKDVAEQPVLEDKQFNQFVGRCVTTLGDRVTEVRASKVLRGSPVRLVAPEDGPEREMARIKRYLDQDYEVPQRILEVNRTHPLIANLARLLDSEPDAPFVPLAIEQLYAGALVQEGLHPNPAEMVPRVQQLLEMASATLAPKQAD